MVSAEVLKTQMDELVNTYNKLAEKMNLPKEEPFDKVGTKHVNNKVRTCLHFTRIFGRLSFVRIVSC